MYPSVWLTIDIGNSAIKAVLFSGNEIPSLSLYPLH